MMTKENNLSNINFPLSNNLYSAGSNDARLDLNWKKDSGPEVTIIVPVFNEEEMVDIFIDKLSATLERCVGSYEILFVDDGSKDETLNFIKARAVGNKSIKYISFSRNFGKEIALTAGLDFTSGNCVVVMDVDLQDPVELIPEMIEKWKEGYQVVAARRRSRQHDKFLKRLSASFFHRTFSFFSDSTTPEDIGDFRLMSRKVVEEIRRYRERNRFMKGIFAYVGFRTFIIDYDRPERAAGETKFSALRLISLAVEGFTSYTVAPLRFATLVGSLVSFAAISYISMIVLKTIFWGVDLPGYASLMSVVLFLGGVQLLCLGVIGEYLAKTYIETKNRPLYIIEESSNFSELFEDK